ncbi:MAG: hypothetical protein FWD23_19260, partial [Oscillospiraceae bacterium]|nr:hypothetical protein [Oscillospiraceae bacterium]
ILFNKSEFMPTQNIKDITTEFSLNLSVPGISRADDTVTYKKYNGKQEYKSLLSSSDFSEPLEYLVINCGRHENSRMTLYPDKKLLTEYKNKSMNFTASNIAQPQKNYINLKIYLENYKVT